MQQAAHPNITQPSSRLYLKVGILCALAVMMDGFDAQATGFVAPALLAEWHITRLALSPILSSGLVGMLAGALLFGPIGDRLGRRRVLVLCTLWFAFGSLLTARAHTVETMLCCALRPASDSAAPCPTPPRSLPNTCRAACGPPA